MKMANIFSNKNILVTGGTGTVGTPVIDKLIDKGAKVTCVSLDSEERVKAVLNKKAEFIHADLTIFENCFEVTKNIDYVIHLTAIKGSTQKGNLDAAKGYVAFILCNTHMIDAAYKNNVKKFLYVGSINEYPPLSIRKEDDVWNGLPAANDKYSGIAKRVGEIQGEAYYEQYGWDAFKIIRLSNVYGPYDDFCTKTCHVIPSLISKFYNTKNNRITIAGDGSAIRDFIYVEDVADACLLALEKAKSNFPINIGSGIGISIKELALTIETNFGKNNKYILEFDKDLPKGDDVRILDISRANSHLHWKPRTKLNDGLKKTIDWYGANKLIADRRGKELHGL